MSVTISHPTNIHNFTRVTVGGLSLWFSYETIIAFQYGMGSPVVSENVWGPTTGKHINYVESNTSRRLPRDEFRAQLSAVLRERGL